MLPAALPLDQPAMALSRSRCQEVPSKARLYLSHLAMLAILGALCVGVGVHASSTTADKPKYVIHIMADDLGYGDVGWKTTKTERVETPTLDALVGAGVEIPEHYSYKMCGPSRVSTLTGRYPYHAGYYNNNGGDDEGALIDYTMLPGQLKKAGWKTHGTFALLSSCPRFTCAAGTNAFCSHPYPQHSGSGTRDGSSSGTLPRTAALTRA